LKVAVVQFPGSNCDLDTLHVLRNVLSLDADLIWHSDFNDSSYDAAVLPGGFSFGDHLRAGIIAAHSPAIESIRKMAEGGRPIIGICNGFQILIEAGLIPGALLRNSSLKFVCNWVSLRVETSRTAFTNLFEETSQIKMPIAHNEGRFFAEDEVLDRLVSERMVVMTYAGENPTGTSRNIASLSNREGNVVGMMPHPERASDPVLGGMDGLRVFESMVEWVRC
jgi:phosphoribosylformylglycinamidine synthase subunit PurQ / glutaminase